MRRFRIFFIITICLLAFVMSGCLSKRSSIEFDDAVEYINEYEEEILILYDMYQDLEESGSEDYAEIRKYREDVLMKEYPFLEFSYYGGWNKMEIWFDNNHDGYDWGVIYNPDPDFDVDRGSNVDAYEEIGNGFYIHTHRHGF